MLQKPALIYCYDAYCGWCYGFSPVIQKIASEYEALLDADVLSGGMVKPDEPIHISATAAYLLGAYKNVEALSGVSFGEDYLWHIKNPEDSDWYPHSEKPAIAMCIFKEFYPERAVEFAGDQQRALYLEGRDLTDNEAYPSILEKYSINEETFFEKMASETYKEMAAYEFALMKQLQVNGFPTVFIQTEDLKFYMIARGYTSYEEVKNRIDAVLKEISVA